METANISLIFKTVSTEITEKVFAVAAKKLPGDFGLHKIVASRNRRPLMLKADYTPQLTPLDELVFTQLVPADHYLRRLKAAVDFARLRSLLVDCYSAQMGRSALGAKANQTCVETNTKQVADDRAAHKLRTRLQPI